ncbi:MAG: hypothetical protein AB7I19_10245 [Planctomycetota bacterium]
MRTQVLATVLAALAAVSTPRAQKIEGGPDPDRRASTLFLSTDSSEVLAGVSISYGAALWQDSYDAMLTALKGGNYTRLGKGWWTSLETCRAIEIGGTKIEAGSYYLGASVDEDGAFTLLIFDSGRAMKAGLLPGSTALYTGEAKAELGAPLTLAKEPPKESVTRLEIEISADPKEPANGRLSLRWGKHELFAPVKFLLPEARKATPRKQ